ncbi:hypothetical protein AQPE_2202 [Aquipluma nitroreducens]|uniref:Uncharacterized protein n=1 Tax=Aquipluma nitroreducens TaxID=2010828 RepID=A0A5K7S920_9BACT|nr:hypothetical protein AQPE_2202 [Aquipluma nitroreducens]
MIKRTKASYIVTFQLIKIKKSVLFSLRIDDGNTLKIVIGDRNFDAEKSPIVFANNGAKILLNVVYFTNKLLQLLG